MREREEAHGWSHHEPRNGEKVTPGDTPHVLLRRADPGGGDLRRKLKSLAQQSPGTRPFSLSGGRESNPPQGLTQPLWAWRTPRPFRLKRALKAQTSDRKRTTTVTNVTGARRQVSSWRRSWQRSPSERPPSASGMMRPVPHLRDLAALALGARTVGGIFPQAEEQALVRQVSLQDLAKVWSEATRYLEGLAERLSCAASQGAFS